jgi:hypothetical protein
LIAGRALSARADDLVVVAARAASSQAHRTP